MRVRTTVTLVADTDIDQEDYKDDDGKPMTPEAILENIKEDIEDDWESAQGNHDFGVKEVNTEILPDK